MPHPAPPVIPGAGVSLDRLRRDLLATAELIDAPADPRLIESSLDAFGEYFSRSAVSFRASTRRPRELNYRYVELGEPHDAYQTALDHGLLEDRDRPVDRLMREVRERFPILGYGVDFGAATGLEKLWPFFPQRPQSVETVCELPSVPPAVRRYDDYFARHGLDAVSLFALDFRHQTANVYFMKAPETYAPDQVAALISELGFEVPSAELLALCSRSVPIYFTFDWSSDEVRRLCFGTVAPTPELAPVHFDPLLERFVAEAPFAAPRKTFLFNITSARDGDYLKIENDYSGSMVELMVQFLDRSAPDGPPPFPRSAP